MTKFKSNEAEAPSRDQPLESSPIRHERSVWDGESATFMAPKAKARTKPKDAAGLK